MYFTFPSIVISDIGRRRKNNEDNFLLGKKYNEKSEARARAAYEFQDYFFSLAVFDGMGGGENGELASRIAAEEVRKACDRDFQSYEEIEQQAVEGFLNANRRITHESDMQMITGTTGTVLLSDGGYFRIFHLGDSRAYLFRDGCLYQLTEDQTLAAMKIELGLYTEDDPRAEIEKHQLTEFIGCDRDYGGVKPKTSRWIEWKVGDRILICSDGLYDMVVDEEIGQIFQENRSLEETIEQLIKLALEHGGVDNVTCVLAEAKRNEQA